MLTPVVTAPGRARRQEDAIVRKTLYDDTQKEEYQGADDPAPA